MSGKSSNLGQFWQELKRRKVVSRNMVYAASGFVILELVSIIAEPFGLPEWTLKLVFILLCTGFIISIILSWFYDFTPDGLESLKSIKQAKEVPPERSSRLIAWKIATYISAILIVGLLLFNILGGRKQAEDISDLEKSIAVLPFKSLSADPDKQYLADGAMDAILLHLSKIEDLRVIPRTSVEQYRKTEKTVSIICQELDVAYLLEGSFQKHGDQVRLIVQLITPGKNANVWAEEYNRNWQDIFSVQSEVAQSIAIELQTIITSEEKQLIEKMPTTSLTAFDFYQRGREEYQKYRAEGLMEAIDANPEVLDRAEDLYNKALEYDSTFAKAYTGLAMVYLAKYYWKSFLTENFLDSMLYLANIALSFDDQLSEAYLIRGEYYQLNYKKEQALIEYDKALIYNPNYWQVYWQKGLLYDHDDLLKSIENYQIVASLQRGPLLPRINRALGWAYGRAGFKKISISYVEEAFKLDNDSALYYKSLASIEDCFGNIETAIDFGEKSYSYDSTDYWVIFLLGTHNLWLGQFQKSLVFFEKYDKLLKTIDRPHTFGTFRLGHAYWVNGFREEAKSYFNKGLEYHNGMIEMGRHFSNDLHTYYNLAAMYAFLGDRDKAYENLGIVNLRTRMPLWMIKDIKNEPLFDSIRDEPEFQQIVQDIEAKYQAEHERVRKWLEENDML